MQLEGQPTSNNAIFLIGIDQQLGEGVGQYLDWRISVFAANQPGR